MKPGALASLAFLGRIVSDFRGVSASLAGLAFLETTSGLTLAAGESAELGDDWPGDTLLVVTATRTFAVALVGRSEEELLVEIADVLVDRVMDDLGQPWPVRGASDDGSPLEPGLVGGLASWVARDSAVCLIGELGATSVTDG